MSKHGEPSTIGAAVVSVQARGAGTRLERYHRAVADDDSDAAILAAVQRILGDREGHRVRPSAKAFKVRGRKQ
jgi:hypothetical protein